ncbi:DNA repair protein RadA [Millisia brevis]|uniref:DNA repair protein RadA n=1 Tax=Millisia brevis TaxID=264148 RepID=UPI0009FD1EEF|nr:DNA repair protein RadA [Millisia brevis]
MAKPRTEYRCAQCAHTVAKWVGRCPSCGEWGSIGEAAGRAPSAATPLDRVDAAGTVAVGTGIGELDRVLGGGVVPGSVILLAGEPGVGKSTLLLEVVRRWADRDESARALYVTGEESAGQVRLRADRTGGAHHRVLLAAETDLDTVLGHVEKIRPSLLVVDSVQTISAAGVEGTLGGVSRVKAVTAAITSLAKSTGVAVILVGHVTKEGAVAGPRTLEHLVDVVLSFEGERHSTLRLIRGIKNRYGSVDEIGCFEMHERGIRQVSDPSRMFLHHRGKPVPGTAVVVTTEGRRPVPGEVQALLAPSAGGSPRRAISGLDSGRLAMILAVLGSAGIDSSKHEVYAATVGGMRTTEPAADLGIALAVASAASGRPLPAGTVVIGEVGLAGEIRAVTALERRLAEAQRLGFTAAIVPSANQSSADRASSDRAATRGSRAGGIRLRPVDTMLDALAAVGINGRRGRPAADSPSEGTRYEGTQFEDTRFEGAQPGAGDRSAVRAIG